MRLEPTEPADALKATSQQGLALFEFNGFQVANILRLLGKSGVVPPDTIQAGARAVCVLVCACVCVCFFV